MIVYYLFVHTLFLSYLNSQQKLFYRLYLYSNTYFSCFPVYISLLCTIALYHQTPLVTNATIQQSEAWYSTYFLSKRPRLESASNLPVYPQRPGEKDCVHYMQTRICKFGDTCKFDHPIWVPEGGIPDWKEVIVIPLSFMWIIMYLITLMWQHKSTATKNLYYDDGYMLSVHEWIDIWPYYYHYFVYATWWCQ